MRWSSDMDTLHRDISVNIAIHDSQFTDTRLKATQISFDIAVIYLQLPADICRDQIDPDTFRVAAFENPAFVYMDTSSNTSVPEADFATRNRRVTYVNVIGDIYRIEENSAKEESQNISQNIRRQKMESGTNLGAFMNDSL